MGGVVRSSPWWATMAFTFEKCYDRVVAFLAWWMVRHGRPGWSAFCAWAGEAAAALGDFWDRCFADRPLGGEFLRSTVVSVAVARLVVAPWARAHVPEAGALAVALLAWALDGARREAALARCHLLEARTLRRVAEVAHTQLHGDRKRMALRVVGHAAEDLNLSLLDGTHASEAELHALLSYVDPENGAATAAIFAAVETADVVAVDRALLGRRRPPPDRLVLAAALLALSLLVDRRATAPTTAAVVVAGLANLADLLARPPPTKLHAFAANAALIDDLRGYLRATK